MKSIGSQGLRSSGLPAVKPGWNRRVWIAGAVLILITAGGFSAYRFYTQAKAQTQVQSQIQTTTARRGDLTLFASGAGTVVPAAEIAIGFNESGVLSELLVKVGDEVEAGQELARLQTSESEEAIEAAIASAELSVLTAQQALDQLKAEAATERATAMQSVATYSQSVKDAQYQLDNYNVPSPQAGLTAMEAVAALKEKLDAARAAFEPYKYFSSGNETRQQLKKALDGAQADYNAAITRLEYEYELEVAQINLEKALADYEKLKDGPDPDDLAKAEAELANAHAQLALTKETESVVELAAPVAGTILAIDASVGESVGSSAFITLADLSQPLIKVYLDETDMDMVKVGYEAEVIFDALPDETFTGSIVSVNPSLVTSSNISTVEALVALDPASFAKPQTLPVGMNATVDVIGGRASGAVLIPVEALREIGTDEYAVFVMESGEPKLRPVTVGLMDLTSAEITSGLEAGETVSTGVVETTAGQE